MKKKVERISGLLADELISWDTVEAVTLTESAEHDPTDPYFFVSMDVFYRKSVPDVNERRKRFPDAAVFESSPGQDKDRFLIESLPVRLEYKQIEEVEEIIRKKEQFIWALNKTGTFMFYRIEVGKILRQKSEWLDTIKENLKDFPDSFWNAFILSLRATMEHHLSDLGAAAFRGDKFFFLISSAGFIKSACSVVFAANHRFEPSSRFIYSKVLELPELPVSFEARLESFLRDDEEFPPERKHKIAELMAKSIISITG